MTVDPKNLCMSLIRADDETEVIKILKDHDLWDEQIYWRDLGDNENNYSIAGAQQADPIAALVEKLVNSIDARWMNECRLAGIRPDGENAPPNIRWAVAQLIEKMPHPESETHGKIENWTRDQRRQNAQKISLAATGSKRNPSITILDEGEGQTPGDVPNTFMSLNKANKLRIPFVQGKFNMGGTGALRFCGSRRIQLIVTRRNPDLLNSNASADDYKWGITVVRRDDPQHGERSSVYRYLAPRNSDEKRKGDILCFDSKALRLRPKGNRPYEEDITFGSFVKLYNYKYKGTSHILLPDGLARAVDVRLPNPALPVMFHECRDYSGDSDRSFENPNTGLLVRLEDDKAGNIEDGFPDNAVLVVDEQRMNVRFYGFKKTRAKTYLTKSEGVIFTVNGQTQGVLPARFFTRKRIGFDAIANSLLACVDCSSLDRKSQEELFMNTRESLAESEFRFKLEESLEKLVRDHPGLKAFNNRRHEENIREKIEENTSFEDALRKIMRQSPALAALFQIGPRISDPFNTKRTGTKANYEGEEFPTYFRFKDLKYGEKLERSVEYGRTARIRLETDAENSYFGRTKEPGVFALTCHDCSGEPVPLSDYSLNPYNGIATLNVELPSVFGVGSVAKLRLEVSDNNRLEPFLNEAQLSIVPFVNRKPGEKGVRQKPSSEEEGDDRLTPSGLAIPNTRWVNESEWEEHNFTKQSALRALRRPTEDKNNQAYDFILNADNIHLLHEMKHGDPEVVKEQFRIGITLIALAVIHSCKDDEDGEAIQDKVNFSCNATAMMLIPIMNALSALDAKDLVSE